VKTQLQRIEIRNFKAFREFTLRLEGRHLLIYGANGSGKSSLYWALYTFLQSARNPTAEVSKYFDSTHPEGLLNIHEPDPVANPGAIALTLRELATNSDTTYRIALNAHDTRRQPVILKGDLASDFVTYRFFFGFSDFRNSEKIDLWPLFEREILPFCVSTGGEVPLDCWRAIKSGNPNPDAHKGLAGTYAYDAFRGRVKAFADILPGIVDAISSAAQCFYDDHFAADDPVKITLRLGVTTLPAFTGTSQQTSRFRPPIIELHIQMAGTTGTITRPQAYLNEAKMTQLALSIRFAASLVNLHDSDLKLLVLDDILVSLDMSNRMKVVEILLSDTFGSYQKIILTHDLGLFREFRRMIAGDHTTWCFRSLSGNAKNGIVSSEEKSPLEKAASYISGNDLEEAAFQLRKAVENTAKQYKQFAMKKIPVPGEFHSLSEDLKAAKNHLERQLPLKFYQMAVNNVPKVHRDKLVSVSDTDIDADDTLDAPTKGILKCQRKRLKSFLTSTAWQYLEAVVTIDSVLRMKDRVLNPAVHWGETPLYEAEVKKALTLIERLEKLLAAKHGPVSK